MNGVYRIAQSRPTNHSYSDLIAKAKLNTNGPDDEPRTRMIFSRGPTSLRKSLYAPNTNGFELELYGSHMQRSTILAYASRCSLIIDTLLYKGVRAVKANVQHGRELRCGIFFQVTPSKVRITTLQSSKTRSKHMFCLWVPVRLPRFAYLVKKPHTEQAFLSFMPSSSVQIW